MSSRVFGPPRGARPPSIIRQRQRKRTSSCPRNVASSRPRGRKDSVPKTSLRKESVPRVRLPKDSAPSVSFRDSEPKSGTGKESNVVSLSKDSAPAFDISVVKNIKETDSASDRRSARGFSWAISQLHFYQHFNLFHVYSLKRNWKWHNSDYQHYYLEK